MSKMATVPLTIRPFVGADAPAVEHILSEAPQAALWSAASLEHFSADSGGGRVLFLLCESEGRVSGFILAQQVADEAEILDLAVLPAQRRRGQASSLLAAALAQLRAHGAFRIFLEVRESNTTAISFYRKHQFEVMGRRPAYYHNPDEAALRMMKTLPLGD